MSLESDKFFTLLGSSGGTLPALVEYWRDCLKVEEAVLSNYAVTALVKPELTIHGQIYYGRVQMLKEQIEYASKFLKP